MRAIIAFGITSVPIRYDSVYSLHYIYDDLCYENQDILLSKTIFTISQHINIWMCTAGGTVTSYGILSFMLTRKCIENLVIIISWIHQAPNRPSWMIGGLLSYVGCCNQSYFFLFIFALLPSAFFVNPLGEPLRGFAVNASILA